MNKYITFERITQGCCALVLAAAIGTGAVLQTATHAEAVELPEPPQIVGRMELPATITEQALAVYRAEPLKRARGVLPDAPESNTSQEEKPADIADNPVGEKPETVDNQETEPQMTYLGSYKITGYDTCAKCCGNTKGITASGTTATVGRTCAAPKDIPFGTRLYIEGIGERIVEDRGGAVKGNKIDVLCEDHPACYAITGTYDVWIVEG